MSDFSHLEDGRVRMVDIGDKEHIDRVAIAEGSIFLSPSTIEAINAESVEKGNVLQTARVAGIQAVKRTPEAIPLCHPLPISSIDIRFDIGDGYVTATAEVRTTAQTGVEMEALNGVSGALLTIWDMVKSLEKDADGQYPATRIGDIEVVKKVKGD